MGINALWFVITHLHNIRGMQLLHIIFLILSNSVYEVYYTAIYIVICIYTCMVMHQYIMCTCHQHRYIHECMHVASYINY